MRRNPPPADRVHRLAAYPPSSRPHRRRSAPPSAARCRIARRRSLPRRRASAARSRGPPAPPPRPREVPTAVAADQRQAGGAAAGAPRMRCTSCRSVKVDQHLRSRCQMPCTRRTQAPAAVNQTMTGTGSGGRQPGRAATAGSVCGAHLVAENEPVAAATAPERTRPSFGSTTPGSPHPPREVVVTAANWPPWRGRRDRTRTPARQWARARQRALAEQPLTAHGEGLRSARLRFPVGDAGRC